MKSWKSLVKGALATVLSAAMLASAAPVSYLGLNAKADSASLQTAVTNNLVVEQSAIHQQLTTITGQDIALPTSIDGAEGATVTYSVPDNPYVILDGTNLKVVKQPYASEENYTFNLTATVTDKEGNTATKDFPMIIRAGLSDNDMAGYLYVCFADPASGGDVQQIHFFLSEDGLNWTAVNGCLPAYMVGTDYPTDDYSFTKDWNLADITEERKYDSTPKSKKNGAFYDESDIESTTSGDASVLFPFEGRDHGLRDPYLIRGSLADGSDKNTIRILATDLNIYCRQYGSNGENWGRMTSSVESGDNYAASSGSGGSKQLFVYETTDLVHWERRTVDVGSEIGGGCAWAPEAIYNPVKDNYLVYWSCRIQGDGWARNRLYCNETKDFKTFGPTKLYEEEPFFESYKEKYPNYPVGTNDGSSDGFGNIDTSQLWVAEGNNPYATLYRVVKDETNNHIELMSAKSVLDPSKDYDATNPIRKKDGVAASDGTSTDNARVVWEYYIDESVGNHFTKIDQENMEKYNGAYEGATMFKFIDRDEWCIMIDYYGSSKVRYEPYTTTDLSAANSVNKAASGTYGRTGGDVGCHGGMIPITVAEYNKIIDTYNNPDRYAEITGFSADTIRTSKNQSGYVYHDIEYISVDKSELNDVVAALSEAVKDSKTYSAAQIAEMNKLISSGKSLASNSTASSAEIDQLIAQASDILYAVSLSTNSVSVKVGATATVTSATSDLVWNSADPSIATVANGVIKGVKEGKTTITATNSKGVSASVAVTVTSAVTPSLKLSASSVTLTVGASKKITATVVPATDKVTWKSSKDSVATVKDGKITAKKAGSAKITATSSSGKSQTITVTVKEKDSLSIKASKTTVKVKKKITLTATAKGSLKAANTKWSLKKGAKLAKLSKAKGKSVKLTAKKKGTVVVKAVCGKLSKTVTIKIKK